MGRPRGAAERKRDLKGAEEGKSKQMLEVRNLKDFGLVTSFVEEKPGPSRPTRTGRIAAAHDFGGLNIRDARTGELVHEYASKGVGASPIAATALCWWQESSPGR